MNYACFIVSNGWFVGQIRDAKAANAKLNKVGSRPNGTILSYVVQAWM